MQKSENIIRYTAAELDEMLARGEDRTDWARVDALTEDELEASIDWEEEGGEPYPFTARAGAPLHTQSVTIPVDRAIANWFRARGPVYQSQMTAVLVNYVHFEERRAAETHTPSRARRAG